MATFRSMSVVTVRHTSQLGALQIKRRCCTVRNSQVFVTFFVLIYVSQMCAFLYAMWHKYAYLLTSLQPPWQIRRVKLRDAAPQPPNISIHPSQSVPVGPAALRRSPNALAGDRAPIPPLSDLPRAVCTAADGHISRMTNHRTLDGLEADLSAAMRVALQSLQAARKLATSLDGGCDAMAAQAEEIAAAARDLVTCCSSASRTKGNSPEKIADGEADDEVPPPPAFAPLEMSEHAADEWVGSPIAPANQQPSVWSGFYNKTLRERLDVLALMYPRVARPKTAPTQDASATTATVSDTGDALARLGELPLRTANHMIENCIGTIALPLGLGLNFVIDGRSVSVPMAVEEPSVVAAASSAAKLVAAAGGGFRTATTGNVMTAQIQLVDTPDLPAASAAIAANRERLLALANTSLCASMKKRGGGAVDLYCRVVSQRARARQVQDRDGSYWYAPLADELDIQAARDDVEYLVVHVDVDVCEAMGANVVNTVAEGLADEVARLARCRRVGLRILTNLAMQRRARATFEIPVAKLGWKGVAGEEVAARIVEAYNFAAIDPYRAVTHNKGIMNGVDAVALATGQDWRALEASAHCYASRSGQYASLSKYEVVDVNGTSVLRGSLELPVAVGSKGGALLTHPGYASTHAVLHHPTARELGAVLVSVGLAQNLAAVRAIAVTGIQRGHMALHARNLAVAAGAPSELVAEVCSYMLGRQSINVETAKEYLAAHAVFSELQSSPRSPVGGSQTPPPSMFYVELPIPHLEGHISLNIAFEAIHKHPQYIALVPSGSPSPLQRQLLGDKGYNQLEKMFLFLESLRAIVLSAVKRDPPSPSLRVTQANLALQNKLQLLSILLNIVAYRLLEVRPQVVRAFMLNILGDGEGAGLDAARHRALLADVAADDDVLAIGLPLFVALWQVLHYHIEQEIPVALLRERLVREQWRLLGNIVKSFELGPLTAVVATEAPRDSDPAQLDAPFLEYVAVQTKRWQATMLLLIDSAALATDLVTPERLDFLARIGEYMEWEGTIAHDLARFHRDLTERVPNAFLFWLARRGIAFADADQHVEEFRRLADALGADKWARVSADKASWQASAFSLPAVEHVTRLIHEIYGERRGRRSRKESF